ncbi:MAG TPA: DUF6498-containing protein [Candidatus Limnocylindrales bacterium]|nr:DUF6498-containing protein [Candidatus Limnocylindrales bacterium]
MTMRRAAHASPVAIALLVAANAIPLLGVLFWGWDLATIVALYWLENGVIGAFALAKMATAQAEDPNPGSVTVNGRAVPVAQLRNPVTARVVLMPFFVVHYGMFWLVHGLFAVVFMPVMWSDMAGGEEVQFASLGAILWAIPILVISHGASFLFNWWWGGERLTSTPSREMFAPYGRVIILHVTIVFGAFIVAFLGEPIGALLLLVGLKTVADLASHLAERSKADARAQSGGVTLMKMPGATVSFRAGSGPFSPPQRPEPMSTSVSPLEPPQPPPPPGG